MADNVPNLAIEDLQKAYLTIKQLESDLNEAKVKINDITTLETSLKNASLREEQLKKEILDLTTNKKQTKSKINDLADNVVQNLVVSIDEDTVKILVEYISKLLVSRY